MTNADDKMRKWRLKNAVGKMRIEKCGWKNADGKLRIDGKLRMTMRA